MDPVLLAYLALGARLDKESENSYGSNCAKNCSGIFNWLLLSGGEDDSTGYSGCTGCGVCVHY